MGGIAGYVRTSGVEIGGARLLAMLRAVRHRGPDDEGLAFVPSFAAYPERFTTHESAPGVRDARLDHPDRAGPHRIAVGHRRFSIIDLSAAAHQPFFSTDGEVGLAFNGEIYNYVEVRTELARLGRRFHTRSDTEVLLEAYREWGVECFERLNGFFALALFDARRGALLLARDRVGKAPLYLTACAEGVFFCSEIKGLVAARGRGAFSVDEAALDDFVRAGRRDVWNRTFYREIASFPAASYAWIEPQGMTSPQAYWAVPTRRRGEREISAQDAATELRGLLADAVRIRLRADVPVGLDLSGGLDSSSIVALACQAERAERLRVFTVSYPGSEFDEADFARQVARRYAADVDHTFLTPTHEDLLDELDGFVAHMDEPFHDPQILNLRDMWRAMRRAGIRVSLNGAAGDELLAGYPVFFEPYLRHLLAHGRPLRFGHEFFAYTDQEPARFGWQHLQRAYHLLPDALRLYHNPATDVPRDVDPYRPARGLPPSAGPARAIAPLLVDLMTQWQMNYWCRVGNQNSMSVPLEFRCPFLDYRLVDLAFTLPLGYLIRDGWLKWLLRRSMQDLLPGEIVWRRRKGGFRYPLAERLPASRERLIGMLRGGECPYVDLSRLEHGFDEIRGRDPSYLWRLLSVAMWWKRCVLGDALSDAQPTVRNGVPSASVVTAATE